MKHEYFYGYGSVLLNPLMWEDIEELRNLRNRYKECFITQNEIERNSQISWFTNYLKKEGEYMFKLVKKEKPDIFIGAVGLYHINRKQKYAEVGRLVVDKVKAPEPGIGTEAMKAICCFGFETLGLAEIGSEVLKENNRSLQMHLKTGFHIVGGSETVYALKISAGQVKLK